MNPKTIAIINMVLCVRPYVANSGIGAREENSLIGTRAQHGKLLNTSSSLRMFHS